MCKFKAGEYVKHNKNDYQVFYIHLEISHPILGDSCLYKCSSIFGDEDKIYTFLESDLETIERKSIDFGADFDDSDEEESTKSLFEVGDFVKHESNDFHEFQVVGILYPVNNKDGFCLCQCESLTFDDEKILNYPETDLVKIDKSEKQIGSIIEYIRISDPPENIRPKYASHAIRSMKTLRDDSPSLVGPQNNSLYTILFLSTDPTDASRLRLGEELREIQEMLQLAKLRERFELHQRMSARPPDVSQALLDVQPEIVHFSGHGTDAGALCFENLIGETHPIQPSALAALFEQFADHVACVLLNACYSEVQATAIAEHIDYVVGMNQTIGDRAAIAFAVGFYQAIGAGRTIEEAYKLGCVQIRLQGIPEHLTPVLISR